MEPALLVAMVALEVAVTVKTLAVGVELTEPQTQAAAVAVVLVDRERHNREPTAALA
jgi:hypothetical protein